MGIIPKWHQNLVSDGLTETLTTRMAEHLTELMYEAGLKVRYIED
jgi:excinuclease UvrABC helicase subunit UvrB